MKVYLSTGYLSDRGKISDKWWWSLCLNGICINSTKGYSTKSNAKRAFKNWLFFARNEININFYCIIWEEK